MDKLLEILKSAGFPYAYDHFAEGEAPDPPFVCYLLPGSDNFSADGKVYYRISEARVELYTDQKDFAAEGKRRAGRIRKWREQEMSAKKNKVKFNICNVHYALITVDEDGDVTFGTPVAMPGAVSLSLEPNGEPSNFYADGYAYYTISNNMGYEGDLELAMVPESFRTDVLKESLDDNSVLVESANVETANFALLFEFDGDVKKIRHVLYNCSAARPNIESATNEEEIEVQTETLAITAAPLANGYVKARTGDSTTDTVYTGWYTSVYMPTVTDPEASGVQQSGLQEMEEDEIGGETL